jgi:anthranilate phosphoribosyltransferase
VQQWIKEVARGKKGARDLTTEQAVEAARTIVSAEATDAQLAAFLVALRIKTESEAEGLALTAELRRSAQIVPVDPHVRQRMIDLSGPYNGRNMFCATLPSALLLAEQGIPVYLHASDSLPPRKGTSLKDMLLELGVPIARKPEHIGRCIEEVGLGFGWTERLCPSLAKMRPVREQIGVRTFLNTAEKLLNLCGAHHIMLGVFHKTVLELNTALIRASGYEKGWIVQGEEGSEDLPVHRKSFIYEITPDDVRQIQIDPGNYGLKHDRDLARKPLSLQEQIVFIRRVAEGETGDNDLLQTYRDQVVLNTGVRYTLCGLTPTIENGIALADEQLRNGAAAKRLHQWKLYMTDALAREDHTTESESR